MTIDIDNPAVLRVIKGADPARTVVAAWDSGNGPYNLVVITNEAQPNNLYRFRGEDGASADPTCTLQSEADFEWRAAKPYLPRFVIRTLATGVLQLRALYLDGTFDNRNLNPPPAGTFPGDVWPASLPARRLSPFDLE